MKPEIRPTIREFSKEHSPEERKEAAQEIRVKRGEYFERKQRVSEEIRELIPRAKEKETNVAEIIQEVQELERALAERKSNKIKELLNYFEIKKVKEEIGIKGITKKEFEREYQNISDMLESLGQQLEDKKELAEAKELLSDFYGKQTEKWKEYQEELLSSDIKNIAKEHDVVFIHGTHPVAVPGGNSLLHMGVDWQTKLRILLSLEPTISASTIRKGDTHRNMWARMGVVLSGGSVLNAHNQDAGTVATGLKKREKLSITYGSIKENIERSIVHRGGGYNELVVEDPQIAGFYVCLDDIDSNRTRDLVGLKEIVTEAKELNMPLYAIQEGRVYEAEYNSKVAKLVPKEEVSTGQILQKKFQLTELQKEKIMEELFVDPPFRIGFPEGQYIDSRSCGAKTYIEINTSRNPEKFGKKNIEYQQNEKEYGGVIENGTSARVIAEIRAVASDIQYLEVNGKLFQRREYRNTGEVWVGCVHAFDEFNHGYIQIGFNTHKLKGPVNSNEAYLSGMEESIKEVRGERDEIQETDDKRRAEFYNQWLNKLAYHLYGFAEQAGEFGDDDVQKRAFKLAKQVLPEEYYREVLGRRLDKEGRFKITKHDLE